ncbi:MAG: hypothetical protein GY710_00450 [Desulfobacteraceae bacterium]|nr:hypothetical protein [Desulfobacteraceae bacterium]
MLKYYGRVIDLLQKDVKFCLDYDPTNPVASLRFYVKFLAAKKRVIQSARDAGRNASLLELDELISLGDIHSDKLFQEYFKNNNFDLYDRVEFFLEGDIERLWDMGENLRKPLIYEDYRMYLDHLIQMIKLALEEVDITNKTFKGHERVALMAELDSAKIKINTAKEKRLGYLRASADKSKFKKEVLRFLGWKRLMGLTNLKTADLITRLKKKSAEYKKECDKLKLKLVKNKHFVFRRVNNNLSRRLVLIRQLENRAQYYIKTLGALQRGKALAKNSAKLSSERAISCYASADKKVTFLDKSVQSHLHPKDFSVDSEGQIENMQNELDDLIMEKLIKLVQRIKNLEDLKKSYRGHANSSLHRSYEDQLKLLYGKKQKLLRRQQDLMEKLSLANLTYGGVMETIYNETAAHKTMLAKRDWVKRECKNLQKLKNVATALNVYCSLYDFSFGLMLSIGNMVGADAGKSVNKNLSGKGMEHLSKTLIVGGISPFAKAYDTGSFNLSLKLGLSFGPDLGGQVSSTMGLVLVYSAKIAVGDTRGFKADSSFVLKATGETKIPKVFKASLELDLYKNQAIFKFQDQYHWAAWFCQAFARLVAMVRAWDQVCMEQRMNQFGQPTPSQMQELRQIADITMQSEPHLKNILDEIAVYTNYRVTKVENKSILGTCKASGSLAGDFIGGGVTAQRSLPSNYSRVKLDSNGVVMKDLASGYEVMEQRKSKGWSVKGNFIFPCVTAVITFTHCENLPGPESNGNTIFIQLNFLGISGVKIGNKAAPGSDPSFDGAFSKWIEKYLLFAANKVDTAIPGWTSGFEGVLKNKEITNLARQYNLAVIECKFYQAKVGSEKQWVLQYWWLNGGVRNSIDIKVPTFQGLTIVTGAEFSLNRSYWERIGTNSMFYIRKVYKGFCSIKEQVQGVTRTQRTLRPAWASGKPLWKRFKEAHQKNLWRLGCNIGTKGTWVRKEVEASGVNFRPLTWFCEKILIRQGSFSQSYFTRLMVKMEVFLESMAQKIAGEEDPKWQEVRYTSKEEKKFNLASKDLVKEPDRIQFLNMSKTLEMKMKPFKKKHVFSRGTPFTLADCKKAFSDAGYDMENAFQTLKVQAVSASPGKFQVLESTDPIDGAIQACTYYMKDLDKASDLNFFKIKHRHGSAGVARAFCLRNCLFIIKNSYNPQTRLTKAREFIQKYIKSKLTPRDIDDFLHNKRSAFNGSKTMYIDTLIAYKTALNGGGKSPHSLRTIIKRQCAVWV